MRAPVSPSRAGSQKGTKPHQAEARKEIPISGRTSPRRCKQSSCSSALCEQIATHQSPIPRARAAALIQLANATRFELKATYMQPLAGHAYRPAIVFRHTAPPRPDTPLSERELEVARLIAAGYSNKQMASELGISHNTVARHVANIMRKMQAGNRTEAVLNAIRQQLIPFG